MPKDGGRGETSKGFVNAYNADDSRPQKLLDLLSGIMGICKRKRSKTFIIQMVNDLAPLKNGQ